MSEPDERVTCFLRRAGDVLLVEAPGGVLDGLTGQVTSLDPERDARRVLNEAAGLLDGVYLAKAGAALDTEVDGARTRVHPFLFDLEDTAAADAVPGGTWMAATGMLRRPTVPGLWQAYRRVAPTLEDVHLGREFGSSRLAEEALQVLRDAAGEADASGDPRAVRVLNDLAGRLVATREAMAVVGNRVLRAVHAADDAAGIERAAHRGIAAGRDAERRVARHAAARISGQRVLTLSRSESVLAALLAATPPPTEVLVAASLPGGEGHDVAGLLHAAGIRVVLIPDACAAPELAGGEVDCVLLGADAVLASGDLVNKAGSRAIALAALSEGVPVYVATSVDKCRADNTASLEPLPAAAVFPGHTGSIPVRATRLDRTPARCIAAYLTERGDVVPGAMVAAADTDAAEGTDAAAGGD